MSGHLPPSQVPPANGRPFAETENLTSTYIEVDAVGDTTVRPARPEFLGRTRPPEPPASTPIPPQTPPPPEESRE
jgi:hypothetical protein